MNTLKTFRLWLEPDRDFPQFERLAWEIVDVSIRDVLMGGVHPWSPMSSGHDKHPSLAEAFVQRLNEEDSKVASLSSFNYCYKLFAEQGYYNDKKTRFERNLEGIKKAVYFVGDLSYLQLLEMAKCHLRDTWCNAVARGLTDRMCPGFQELRRFLKGKDESIRLSGYDDIVRYDLGDILSLEDFEGRDSLIISEAIPSLNFRKASCLDKVRDGQGRLRLVPEIAKVTITGIPTSTDYVNLLWHVEREGETCRFRPTLEKSETKRAKAREFAEKWRMDEGRLCFSTSIERLSEMVETRAVVPSFPALNYTYEHSGPTATAEVQASRIQAFHIGGFLDYKNTGEQIKEILREYGVSMTGNKNALLKKLAKLAAEQYEEKKPKLDAFFSEHRFVRVNATPPKTGNLPILRDAPTLRNLLLTMFAMKHLRGNAILETSHDNNTYTEEQLASALLHGKVELKGTFLRVV